MARDMIRIASNEPVDDHEAPQPVIHSRVTSDMVDLHTVESGNHNFSTVPSESYIPPQFTISERGDAVRMPEKVRQSINGIHTSVWHVMPGSHRKGLAAVAIVYIIITFMLCVSSASVMSHNDLGHCRSGVRKFLTGFTVTGFIFVVLCPMYLLFFRMKILPELFVGRPFPDKGIYFTILVVALAVIQFCLSIYGLHQAGSHSTYQRERCGAPHSATNGLSGAYMALGFCFTAAYVAHYQWMLSKLQQSQRLAVIATSN